MAATNEQVIAWLTANPTATDAQITAIANETGVTPAQLAAVTGLPEASIAARMGTAPSLLSPVSAPPPPPPPPPTPASPSYKDYLGSTDYLGKIVDSLNSGQTKVVTSRNVTGTIVTDEYGTPVFQPFLTEQEGGGNPRALTPAEIAQAKYNPTTERTELTVPVSVAPYIDTSKIPNFPIETWPVQDLGNGAYKLSVMNNSNNGYANVLFQPDATGKATITESNPTSFESYDAGNFFSNFAGAAKDLASSDAAKLIALAAAGGAFTPVGAAGAAGAGAGAGGLSAFDAMGADMVTGALPGAATAATLTAPSALDVLGADMVTGAMPGVASTLAPVVAGTGTTLGTGLTLPGIIKALPLISTVASLVNPPTTPTPTTTGATGFGIVPIPTEWRSPTYSAPSAPIDLNSIFSTQNMLGGTQWQGLPNQRNVSFNDIFASGQQQTPMGTPVNINQIVSAILGQNPASQSPA